MKILALSQYYDNQGHKKAIFWTSRNLQSFNNDILIFDTDWEC